MKIALTYPNTTVHDGAEVAVFARAAEAIGYDQIDIYDHVVMAHPLPGEPAGQYPTDMPLMEPLTGLSFMAACTERIGLGPEVLVLPQRPAVLVAKQIATLDRLSGGRIRLGVGIGWQEREYEALGVPFSRRGARVDEAIRLLRMCWSEPSITFEGRFNRVRAVSMEPKPVQPGGPPIWIGGGSPAALKRVGTLGDGWLGGMNVGAEQIATIRRHAEEAGRDPNALGFQAWTAPPAPGAEERCRAIYSDLDGVAATAARAAADGFGWISVNATGVALTCGPSLDDRIEALGRVYERVRREVG